MKTPLELLDDLSKTLTVPAAEYVPAIPDAWAIIDQLRAALRTEPRPSSSDQAVEARGLPRLPTDEQIELFAAKLVRERRLIWSGFRDDGTIPDRQNYTIPVVNQSVGDLVRAALAAQADARREDTAMLDWLVSQLSDRDFREAGISFRHGDRDFRPSFRAAMNTTKGADHAE